MTAAAPLAGVRIVEFEGIGPGPLAGRMLAGMGASVTLVARPRAGGVFERLREGGHGELERGKARVELDLKTDAGRLAALNLVAAADASIEGLRPGVMERLGLGPADCARRNPRLVYGRMTGWGQSGPLAHAPGHDLNYVALTGILSLSARPGLPPIVPPTVVGDASGALGLSFGIACALLQARSTGRGCVVDAAIVDIVAMLGTLAQWACAGGLLAGGQPSLFHDSPFYDVYACLDGQCITLGAIEPAFYAELLARLGLDDVDPKQQFDRSTWPALKQRIRDRIGQRSRDDWCRELGGTEVCFAPVLSMAEAAVHPHNAHRANHVASGGHYFGAVAPRFAPLQPD